MTRYLRTLLLSSFLVLIFSIIVPAYAEVSSLETDKTLYSAGDKIHFLGSVGISDYQKLVNLVVRDPTGKFIVIAGNYSDSSYLFEITVDTSNVGQFSTKGTYQATAFVGKESEGKTVNFDFSPDRSPVLHQPSANSGSLDSSISKQTQPRDYSIKITDGVGISESASSVGIPTSGVGKAVLPPPAVKEQPLTMNLMDVLYLTILVLAAGTTAVVLFLRKRKKVVTPVDAEKKQSSFNMGDEDDDYAMSVLKNRLAKGEITIEEYQSIKEVLVEP